DSVLFATSAKGFLYAIDASNGKEKWRLKADASSPVVRDRMVYFDDDSNLYSVEADSGVLRWKIKAPGKVATQLAINKSSIFYGGNDSKLYAINAATGNLVWSAKIGGTLFDPVTVKDRVFVGGTNKLAMVDAGTGEVFPTVKMGLASVSTPA